MRQTGVSVNMAKFFSLALLIVAVVVGIAMAASFRGDGDSGGQSTASANMGAELTKAPGASTAPPAPEPTRSDSPGDTVASFYSSFSATRSSDDTPASVIVVIEDPVLVNDADDGFVTDWRSMTISGRVTDPWGRGIAGIEVQAFSDSVGAMSNLNVFFTDPDGFYEISIYSPGIFNILFSPTRLQPDSSSFWTREWYNNAATAAAALGVPHGSSGVDAVLSGTGILRGRVGFRSTGPWSTGDFVDYNWPFEMNVVAFRADRPELVGALPISPVTGLYNNFSFAEHNILPPGDYKILFMPRMAMEPGSFWSPTWHGGQSWETAQTVTVTPGQLTSIEAYIEPSVKASLYGSLRVDDWSPFLPESVVALVDATDPSRVIATRNNASYFVFDEVTAGDAYKLRFTSTVGQTFWYLDNRQYATEDFDAATMISIPDDPATSASMGPLDFSVWTRTATAAGRVIRADGTPVSFVNVQAIETGSQRFDPQFRGLTESDGRFSSSLVPGSYSFCVYDWETGTRYCHDIAVTLGDHESATDIDIVIPSAAAPVPAATAAISDPAQPVTTIEAHSGDETPSADTASEADDPSPAPDSATMSAADEKTR